MEGLILAAGEGSRLNHSFSPKPLVPIHGASLIEHIIVSTHAAGISKLRIVVGYKADLVKSHIGDGKKFGVEISYILNTDWRKGNGLSVLKAKDHFQDRFILLMADHLFDTAILHRIKNGRLSDENSIICVDRNLKGRHINISDASKVWAENTQVKKIGKKIRRFNAIDSGIFHYAPHIFDALETSVSQGDDTLCGGNQVLADRGLLSTLDISDHFWIDIDEPKDLQLAKELLEAKRSAE